MMINEVTVCIGITIGFSKLKTKIIIPPEKTGFINFKLNGKILI